MSDKSKSNLPTQKDLEKELADYLSKKYGEKVKVVSAGVFPQTDSDENEAEKEKVPLDDSFDFSVKPEELVAYLDEYVIKQDEAKAILSTKICTHFNRIRYETENHGSTDRSIGRIKSNVLMIGPTGVGKTYLIKLIAQRLGVPFIKGDATKFSETGYVGGDVEDLVRDLVRQADGDIEKAQYGIVYVDEIDKIASSQNRIGADVSRTGVQRALLKPMEETEVDLKVPHDPISQIEAIEHYRQTGKREKRTVNTRNILFIMSGAFAGLDEIIRKRSQKQSIGFEGCLSNKKDACRLLKKVRAEDLIEFGFESEFVGRLPVLAILEELSEDDLYSILTSLNSSLIIAKKQDFLAYGIKIQFEQESLLDIAEKAHDQQIGARGLVSILEQVLLPFEKSLPSTDVKVLAVTKEMVKNPAEELEELLSNEEYLQKNHELYAMLAKKELQQLEKMVLRTVGDYLEEFEVLPTPERIKIMALKSQEENLDPYDIADAIIDRVDQIEQFAKRMSEKCNIHVEFSQEAIDRILMRQSLTTRSVRNTLKKLQKDYEYGLCLLGQNKDVGKIIVPAEGVDLPRKYMEELVDNTFRL